MTSSREIDTRITRENVLASDAVAIALLAGSCHYDYRAQTWRDGRDHIHAVYTSGNPDTSEFLFCGADLETCRGLDLETICQK